MTLHFVKPLALLLLLSATAFAQRKKPNVIILLTDDQGYGDMGCTGNSVLKTPEMDRLYSESVRFSNFHVDSYCAPTRSALMTGRYSHRVGVWATIAGRNMLRDEEITMADVFHHNGYRTGMFGKWHLGSNDPYRPMDRGFEEWLGHGDGGTGCTTDFWNNDRVNDHYIHNGEWEKEARKGYEADVFFDAAMQFIRDHKSEPFFTYIALYNPHSPCSLPDPNWTSPYQEKGLPSDFYASIARVDFNLGRLRGFLKSEGLAENTLLIFLSDNGTAEGDKIHNAGMRGKKGSPYDGGHRVPCFIHWPAGGLDKPVTVDRLTAHIDILPTLVNICPLTLPKSIAFDGMNLLPLLTEPNSNWPDRTIVLGTVPNAGGAVNPGLPPFGKNCAVMTDRWRLVQDRELYDMTADPGQSSDLASEYPDVVGRLQNAYKAYWSDVSDKDKDWRGRPNIRAKSGVMTALSSEDWYPTLGSCPWNQGHVAEGAKHFGYWSVRIVDAGSYTIEIRRWPRETDATMMGIPAARETVDAYLNKKPVSGTLYDGKLTALPISKVRLKLGAGIQELPVCPTDKSVVFKVNAAAGDTEIEATFLNDVGQPLCDAFYAYIQHNP